MVGYSNRLIITSRCGFSLTRSRRTCRKMEPAAGHQKGCQSQWGLQYVISVKACRVHALVELQIFSKRALPLPRSKEFVPRVIEEEKQEIAMVEASSPLAKNKASHTPGATSHQKPPDGALSPSLFRVGFTGMSCRHVGPQRWSVICNSTGDPTLCASPPTHSWQLLLDSKKLRTQMEIM